tara:strand:+ start:1650 stop:1775 length:126 start_codon:yes stop_codon:yes gene_type:complete
MGIKSIGGNKGRKFLTIDAKVSIIEVQVEVALGGLDFGKLA